MLGQHKAYFKYSMFESDQTMGIERNNTSQRYTCNLCTVAIYRIKSDKISSETHKIQDSWEIVSMIDECYIFIIGSVFASYIPIFVPQGIIIVIYYHHHHVDYQ